MTGRFLRISVSILVSPPAPYQLLNQRIFGNIFRLPQSLYHYLIRSHIFACTQQKFAQSHVYYSLQNDFFLNVCYPSFNGG